MEKFNIKDFVSKDVSGNPSQVHFQFFRSGNFYYAVENIYSSDLYEFPVPIEDIGNATLNRTDRALMFMRWIRKAIEGGTFIKQ